MTWWLTALLLTTAYAKVTYQLQCADGGELKSVEVKADPSECASYTSQGMPCGDTRSERDEDLLQRGIRKAEVQERQAHRAGGLLLRSPVETYYSNRESIYEAKKVKEIVDKAVAKGIDPYLMLAIIMVEAPPYHERGIYPSSYLDMYGVPPLDATGFIDVLNCTRGKPFKYKQTAFWMKEDFEFSRKNFPDLEIPKGRWVKKGDSIEMINYDFFQGKVVKSNYIADAEAYVVENEIEATPALSGGKRASIPLFGASEATGNAHTMVITTSELAGYPQVQVKRESEAVADCQKACCADVILPKNYNLHDEALNTYGSPFQKELQSQMGALFIRRKFDWALSLKHVRSMKDPAEKIAATIQSYNGYGVLGSTEKVDNKCIGGIDMKRTPIYGTGVGELMLNTLMGNSQVRALVAEAQARHPGSKVRSIFCEQMGSGTQSVDALAFAQLQKSYLSGRSCPAKRYDFRPAGAAGSGSSQSTR